MERSFIDDRSLHSPSQAGPRPDPNAERIFLSVPHMTGEELGLLAPALSGNWTSPVGPNNAALEAELGQTLGLPTLTASSGTAAIHLGLRMLGVSPGDTVFCSTLTFVASANPIRYLGAEPVFLDSEDRSWNLDPNVLEDALRTHQARPPRALVLTHLYGQSADIEPILALCERYGVAVLEDAAEALGATYHGLPVGTFGDVGAFSLNSNKIITATGGGFLVARDARTLDRARRWASQARLPTLAFCHEEMGYNYRLSEVLAGIARAQLRALSSRVDARRRIFRRYCQALTGIEGLIPMPTPDYGLPTHWLSCFTVDEALYGTSRDQLIAMLGRKNIEARPVWKPMHQQPLYKDATVFGGAVAERLYETGICLPSSSQMTFEQQTRVVEGIIEAQGRTYRRAG